MAAPPGILEVGCAGCGETLEVDHGLTEFACPDCGMAQSLPPELMPPRPRRALPLPGRGAPYAAPVPPAPPAAPARVTCGGCGSVLCMPHGLGRFACPLCGVELASFPLAAVPVVVSPTAVPIPSPRPMNASEVQQPSSQSTRAGMVQKPIHSEQTHGQQYKHYFGEESFNSFRAEPRTQIDAARTLQTEPPKHGQQYKHYFGEESFNSFRAEPRTQIDAARTLQTEPPKHGQQYKHYFGESSNSFRAEPRTQIDAARTLQTEPPKHGQQYKHYFGEESFNSFRAEPRTQIDAARTLQTEPPNPSIRRDESHTEPVQGTIARPGKRTQTDAARTLQNELPNASAHREESHTEPVQGNIARSDKRTYRFVFGPKSWQEGNVQKEQPNQVVHASQAQVMPTESAVHTNQAVGRFPDDPIPIHSKQITEHVDVPSAIEHGQIHSRHQVVHEQQAGENPIDTVHMEQETVDSACKPSSENRKRGENTEGNHKRKNNNLINVHASQAQVMPTESSVHINQADRVLMHGKQRTGHVSVPSTIEHEQARSRHQVDHEQQEGENPSDGVHMGQEKVDYVCKPSDKNIKSTENTKGNRKRKNKNLMNSSNECPHLRRSKRLSKGSSPDLIDVGPIQKLDASPDLIDVEPIQKLDASPDLIDVEPIQKLDASPDLIDVEPIQMLDASPHQNHSEAPQTESSIADQTYSPETRWTLPNPGSSSLHEHEIPQKSSNGIDQLDGSDEEVHSNPSDDQNQYMDGQVAEAACSGKNHSEQVALKPHSKNFAEHGRLLNLAASCSRLAALLPVPASTTLPTISSLSSREKLPLECSSPTTPQNQPRTVIYSQDARCDDMLSGSLSKSSKKRKGRPPSVLVEPRKEADRPVLTPNGTDNWSVDPPFPKKVATTISLLIKQNYPGTCISVDEEGRSREVVVHYWHQCPPDVRATVLDEFLKRYKWAPGHEEECQKIFERKAVKQLVNLFCYEKQRVREELAAKKKKLKGSWAVGRANGELEKGDDKEDLEERQGEGSVVENDDPLNWKPFAPDWMQPAWWEMLCDHWARDEFKKVSYQKRKNRSAGGHPSAAAGSQTIAMRDTTSRHAEEARYPVQEQVGSSKRERYYATPVASKKDQTDPSSKSSPDCLNKQGQQPIFTQEQVQQMINRALQGLNETWEKKFMSLEQNMRRTASSRAVPVDTFDSAEGEEDPAAGGDDGEEQDGHWS
ncbi:hypothetical protein ZWY2020_013441 [Hordeum vulgare]|nr:hypothetical protein ZWY2020_013441 [Hordeum vulgare]